MKSLTSKSNHSSNPRNSFYPPSVFAFVKESGKNQDVECNRNMRAVQCSKQKYPARQLMIAKRTTKKFHNMNINRVESGDENEKADDTTNVCLNYHANCYAKKQLNSNIITNLVVMFCYTME